MESLKIKDGPCLSPFHHLWFCLSSCPSLHFIILQRCSSQLNYTYIPCINMVDVKRKPTNKTLYNSYLSAHFLSRKIRKGNFDNCALSKNITIIRIIAIMDSCCYVCISCYDYVIITTLLLIINASSKNSMIS